VRAEGSFVVQLDAGDVVQTTEPGRVIEFETARDKTYILKPASV
jgi:hypothetical protein